ncbi:Nmad2 family putative nucleotide modification protein [Methylorubrum thiocyanatum]
MWRSDGNGSFRQADSLCSEPGGVLSRENLEVDTGYTDRVLVGWEYAYWGRSARRIPTELREMLPVTQGHLNRLPLPLRVAFVDWLRVMPDRGYIDRPANWP